MATVGISTAMLRALTEWASQAVGKNRTQEMTYRALVLALIFPIMSCTTTSDVTNIDYRSGELREYQEPEAAVKDAVLRDLMGRRGSIVSNFELDGRKTYIYEMPMSFDSNGAYFSITIEKLGEKRTAVYINSRTKSIGPFISGHPKGPEIATQIFSSIEGILQK